MSTTETTQTEPKNAFKAIDPATLGQGLFSEKVNIDVNADAFAFAPPIDDAWYVAVLRLPKDPKTSPVEAITYPARQDKPKLNVVKVNFDYEVESFVDQTIDAATIRGLKRFDDNASTIMKNGTSEVATLLKYFGFEKAIKPGMDIEELALALHQVIASGQARVAIRTQWKAGWVPGDKTVKGSYGSWTLAGQKNFPLLASGKHNPLILVNGNEAKARAQVVEVRPLSAFATQAGQ